MYISKIFSESLLFETPKELETLRDNIEDCKKHIKNLQLRKKYEIDYSKRKSLKIEALKWEMRLQVLRKNMKKYKDDRKKKK